MLKFFILGTIFIATSRFSNQSVGGCHKEKTESKAKYLILIPPYIDDGKINVESKNHRDTSSATYIFSFYPSSPHYLIDAGYFLDVKKAKEEKFNSNCCKF